MPRERSVAFGELVVTEFALGVGDNPAVSGGVPIGLSRQHLGTYKMRVDEFEELRSSRRSTEQLKMDRDTRMKMLVVNGCQEKDIAEAVRTSRNIRHSRERSMSNKGWDPVHEVAEKAFRKVIKPFRAGGPTHKLSPSKYNPMSLQHAAVMTYQKTRRKPLGHGREQAPRQLLSN